jgi:Flp pilus assembly protein CpaB
MSRLAVLRRRVRRTVLARRRLLAALAAAAAVASGLQAAAGPPPPKTPVVTAARDIAGGAVLRPADLESVAFDPRSVPSGVVSSAAEVVGRTTAGPLRAGEPVTDVRLLSGSLLAAYPGMVAAPVRIADAGTVALLDVGDRIDVLAADPQGRSEAVVVAPDAPVIALPHQRATPSPTAPAGGLVVLAVSDATARTLAAAGVSRYLSIVLNR